MKNIFSFLTTFLSFLLIGAGGYGFFLLVNRFLNVFVSFQSDIATAIIVAAIGGFISVVSLVLTKLYEARKDRESVLRDRKVDAYEKVIKFFLDILRNSDKPMGTEEMKEFMYEHGREVFTWGSDKVVKIFSEIRRGAVASLSEDGTDAGVRMLLMYEDLVFEIRKDLGYKNKDLNKGDILSLYINDIDSVIKAK